MVAAVLALIAPVPASAVVPPIVAIAPDPLGDLRGVVASMEAAADRVAVSPEAARRGAEFAAAELATNCPYNRATFVVLLTLDRELAAMDPSALSAPERARFDLIARGVRAQVRLLRSIGGDALPSPIAGDYLAGDYITGVRSFRDGAELAASADPLADAEEIVGQVPALVEAMPGWARDRVRAAWGTLAGTVAEDAWFGAFSRWASELQVLAPSLGERAARLARVLDAHGGMGC